MTRMSQTSRKVKQHLTDMLPEHFEETQDHGYSNDIIQYFQDKIAKQSNTYTRNKRKLADKRQRKTKQKRHNRKKKGLSPGTPSSVATGTSAEDSILLESDSE